MKGLLIEIEANPYHEDKVIRTKAVNDDEDVDEAMEEFISEHEALYSVHIFLSKEEMKKLVNILLEELGYEPIHFEN